MTGNVLISLIIKHSTCVAHHLSIIILSASLLLFSECLPYNEADAIIIIIF